MYYEDLKGKHAIVTGAAQGIGKATAKTLAEQGIHLALCDKNERNLAGTVEELKRYPVTVIPLVVDISKSAEVASAVAACVEAFGCIDILMNCAGISIEATIVETTEEIWDKTIDVNLKGVFLCCREVATHMIKNKIPGKIVTVSSQAAKTGEHSFGAYGCSKAGITALTQALSLEVAKYGINVNAVCPGFINTDMLWNEFRYHGPREGMTPEEYKNRLCSDIPLGRMGEPEEIGALMAFLASQASNYITGVSITIAGGTMLI